MWVCDARKMRDKRDLGKDVEDEYNDEDGKRMTITRKMGMSLWIEDNESVEMVKNWKDERTTRGIGKGCYEEEKEDNDEYRYGNDPYG